MGGEESWEDVLDIVSSAALLWRSRLPSSDKERIFFKACGELMPGRERTSMCRITEEPKHLSVPRLHILFCCRLSAVSEVCVLSPGKLRYLTGGTRDRSTASDALGDERGCFRYSVLGSESWPPHYSTICWAAMKTKKRQSGNTLS